jgi:hypothetical protein
MVVFLVVLLVIALVLAAAFIVSKVAKPPRTHPKRSPEPSRSFSAAPRIHRRLGIFAGATPRAATAKAKKRAKPPKTVELLGRAVPVVRTPDGLRARVKDRAESPASVERYLKQKFGDALPRVRSAMRALAKTQPPKRLEEIAFSLYEKFRPEIPKGTKGWGAKGRLDLNRIRALARRSS